MRNRRRHRPAVRDAGRTIDANLIALIAATLTVLGVGAVVAIEIIPALDGSTLRRSLADLGRTIAPLRFAGDRRAIATFVAGAIIGGGLASWWTHRYMPWRSVLLVDNRVPDMSLDGLLAHVRRQSLHEEREAVQLIQAAAKARALSIWTRSASGAVRRAPRGLVRSALADIDSETTAPARQIRAPSRDNLLFMHSEVRQLWPGRAGITIPAATATLLGSNNLEG